MCQGAPGWSPRPHPAWPTLSRPPHGQAPAHADLIAQDLQVCHGRGRVQWRRPAQLHRVHTLHLRKQRRQLGGHLAHRHQGFTTEMDWIQGFSPPKQLFAGLKWHFDHFLAESFGISGSSLAFSPQLFTSASCKKAVGPQSKRSSKPEPSSETLTSL